jgi:hypothetical protein
MKTKFFLLMLFALISASANSIVPLDYSEQELYYDDYSTYVAEPVTVTNTDINVAWDLFVSDLQLPEISPATIPDPDPATINEALQQQETLMQQLLQVLQNVSRTMYEMMMGIIRNLM